VDIIIKTASINIPSRRFPTSPINPNRLGIIRAPSPAEVTNPLEIFEGAWGKSTVACNIIFGKIAEKKSPIKNKQVKASHKLFKRTKIPRTIAEPIFKISSKFFVDSRFEIREQRPLPIANPNHNMEIPIDAFSGPKDSSVVK